jgi:long-subunit fatty acid transport protein
VVSVNLDGQLTATGIVGAMFQPLDNLSFGASFRPPLPIHASGTLELALGEAARGLNSQTNCVSRTDSSGAVHCENQTDLTLTQPMELRIGARYSPIKKLGINADFVYQGWQSVDELVLAPKNMTLKVGSADAKPVAAFHIPKNWHASYSFRLGASFDVIKYLTLHAGFFYETAAAPDEYAGIDFMHFDRFFISGGATVHLWKVDLVLGAAGTPTVTKAITQSSVAAGSTDPEIPGSIVGAGLYASGGWIITAGLRGRFGTPPAAPPTALVEPAPAPASEPTPAPAPAPAPAT